MKGKLIGIGVGPGDPELITVKALRRLKECGVIIVPDADKGESTAYNIAVKACPEIADKPSVSVVMPMTHDLSELNRAHRLAADKIEKLLDEGKTAAFITLGDATVYSTYMYIHKLVLADGYEAEIVSGVPSFCAAAARLNISLAERAEMLHIVPSSHGVEKALDMPGVKVLMKAGSKMGLVKDSLIRSEKDVYMVENCGMENENVYKSAREIPDGAGYFSLIIVKDRRKS